MTECYLHPFDSYHLQVWPVTKDRISDNHTTDPRTRKDRGDYMIQESKETTGNRTILVISTRFQKGLWSKFIEVKL